MRYQFILSIFISIVLFSSCGKRETNEIDLAGKWQFKIDSLDQGISGKWYETKLSDSIKLPGSMANNGSATITL